MAVMEFIINELWKGLLWKLLYMDDLILKSEIEEGVYDENLINDMIMNVSSGKMKVTTGCRGVHLPDSTTKPLPKAEALCLSICLSVSSFVHLLPTYNSASSSLQDVLQNFMLIAHTISRHLHVNMQPGNVV